MQLVTRLRMLDKGAAVIDWRLRGQLGVFPVDIDFRSTFELDLITGRVKREFARQNAAAVDCHFACMLKSCCMHKVMCKGWMHLCKLSCCRAVPACCMQS